MKIFIVGVGRSGTSLLQSMLNAHPKIAFLPETQFFRKYIASVRKKRKFEQLGIDKFLKILENDENFGRLNIEINDFLSIHGNKYRKKGGLKLEVLYDDLLSFYLSRTNKNIIGDKDPRNIENIAAIKKFYPDSFIIHTIRDPRDVVLSKTKANWSKHRPFWMHALITNSQYKYGKNIGKKLFGRCYYEVNYEELISSPEKTLKKLCQAMSVDYTDKMLEFSKSSKELVSTKELQWKKETLGPILNTNSLKWQKELSSFKIEIINTVCHGIISKENYHLNKNNRFRSIFKIVPVFKIISFCFYLLFYFRIKTRL
jgi:hypothetical protein